eukprot:7989284-Pyramimonas_sp.AAC.1
MGRGRGEGTSPPSPPRAATVSSCTPTPHQNLRYPATAMRSSPQQVTTDAYIWSHRPLAAQSAAQPAGACEANPTRGWRAGALSSSRPHGVLHAGATGHPSLD